jgi:GTP pyrophosphokinase
MLNLNDVERVRLIEAEWQDGADLEELGDYYTEIKIFCNDKPGLLVDVSRVFAERDINIVGIHSRASKQGIATIEVSFRTKGRQQINSLIERLRQIDNVIEIQRTTG